MTAPGRTWRLGNERFTLSGHSPSNKGLLVYYLVNPPFVG